MFDIRAIREDAAAFDAGIARRKLDPIAEQLIEIDKRRRDAQTVAQELQTRRNELSKIIGMKKGKGEDADAEMKEVSDSKDAQAAAEETAKAAGDELEAILCTIPNIPAEDVPEGEDEDDNIELRTWGEPKDLGFEAKEHFDLGEALGQMDFETAAKMSGARFVILSGALARMERALSGFMLDLHTTENGFTEVNPPALVRDHALYGTGQLPKFEADLFKMEEGLYLIPTAEVPLTNILAGELVDEDTLPRRYTAMTWCFRSEAGSAGKDTRGMIRQHQFTKVEMVAVTKPEDSDAEHERMIGCAEEVLKRLELPYRVVSLCLGDLGFSAKKTYDIEVWLAGQGRFREISSVSNCGDFQARRMKARYRPSEGKGTNHVHTLNGSGLAVGRTLVAIMENYQQEDGSIVVPEVLRPYMGGLEKIEA
ncbi:MAG: serine--tRNA ligase [Rhodospirillaceae bacterium]|jgi:seryl-tRNA synthetase|nr:serine--tRNA ligase [Rhodospirillaceae bacterium]MBT4588643.1 serine--tRNA ligase [Rhodospirillaceae bacterium]MBT4937507.1 serine--tRNA ligase [Rhodospirillaceae bacterium]MBT5939910.1 serine--tRNA ligase [Rhodospirillaceae bacterium]MBT7268898.1 serine--tRNA ligase [Rhodospirillaceae bacterium]